MLPVTETKDLIGYIAKFSSEKTRKVMTYVNKTWKQAVSKSSNDEWNKTSEMIRNFVISFLQDSEIEKEDLEAIQNQLKILTPESVPILDQKMALLMTKLLHPKTLTNSKSDLENLENQEDSVENQIKQENLTKKINEIEKILEKKLASFTRIFKERSISYNLPIVRATIFSKKYSKIDEIIKKKLSTYEKRENPQTISQTRLSIQSVTLKQNYTRSFHASIHDLLSQEEIAWEEIVRLFQLLDQNPSDFPDRLSKELDQSLTFTEIQEKLLSLIQEEKSVEKKQFYFSILFEITTLFTKERKTNLLSFFKHYEKYFPVQARMMILSLPFNEEKKASLLAILKDENQVNQILSNQENLSKIETKNKSAAVWNKDHPDVIKLTEKFFGNDQNKSSNYLNQWENYQNSIHGIKEKLGQLTKKGPNQYSYVSKPFSDYELAVGVLNLLYTEVRSLNLIVLLNHKINLLNKWTGDDEDRILVKDPSSPLASLLASVPFRKEAYEKHMKLGIRLSCGNIGSDLMPYITGEKFAILEYYGNMNFSVNFTQPFYVQYPFFLSEKKDEPKFGYTLRNDLNLPQTMEELEAEIVKDLTKMNDSDLIPKKGFRSRFIDIETILLNWKTCPDEDVIKAKEVLLKHNYLEKRFKPISLIMRCFCKGTGTPQIVEKITGEITLSEGQLIYFMVDCMQGSCLKMIFYSSEQDRNNKQDQDLEKVIEKVHSKIQE